MSVKLGPSEENVIDRNVFFLPTGSDVSIREAFNLMRGRVVRKEMGILGDDAYWLRLNMGKEFQGIRSPYIAKGHLDVAAWMRRKPLNKMYSIGEKAAIVRRIEQGDRVLVDRAVPGAIYLEAQPERDKVEIRNERGKVIRPGELDGRVRMVGRKR
jgi:hypothetical protein